MSIDYKDSDVVIPFSFSKIGVRGKILRFNNLSNTIVNNFKITDNIKEVLLDSLSLNAIISSNFKFDGIFKLQLNCFDGLIKVILIDTKSNGDIRGFVSLNNDFTSSKIHHELSFKELITKGYLVFHLDQKIAKPYQAIVAIDGDNLEDVANQWFKDSEQILTYIKFYNDVKTNSAGAIFLQIIPNQYATEEEKEAQKEDFNTLCVLSDTLAKQEMFNDNLTDILYKLYNQFEVVVFDKIYYQYKCSCSLDKIKELVEAFSEQEKEEMYKDTKELEISCQFCGTTYKV
jgi:molecular chaperone Hsp33